MPHFEGQDERILNCCNNDLHCRGAVPVVSWYHMNKLYEMLGSNRTRRDNLVRQMLSTSELALGKSVTSIYLYLDLCVLTSDSLTFDFYSQVSSRFFCPRQKSDKQNVQEAHIVCVIAISIWRDQCSMEYKLFLSMEFLAYIAVRGRSISMQRRSQILPLKV